MLISEVVLLKTEVMHIMHYNAYQEWGTVHCFQLVLG